MSVSYWHPNPLFPHMIEDADEGVGGLGAYDATVARIQQTLKSLGFNPGKVDGLWGKNTKQAVRDFRAAAGLDTDPGRQTQADYLGRDLEVALFGAVEGGRGGAATPVVPRPSVSDRLRPTGGVKADVLVPLPADAVGVGGGLSTPVLIIGGAGLLLILYSLSRKPGGGEATAGFGGIGAIYQRRHYEDAVRRLTESNAGEKEIQRYIDRFSSDNPRFREDFFRAALEGKRRPRSRMPRRTLYQRRHYEDAAKLLAESGASGSRIEREIREFQQQNPSFKPSRFRAAIARYAKR